MAPPREGYKSERGNTMSKARVIRPTVYCGTCGCGKEYYWHTCARGDECEECASNDERARLWVS